MFTAFYLIAALMILAAIALVLVPMVRSGRRSGRSRRVFALTLSLAFVLPLAAIGVYDLVGTPAAIDPAVRAGSDQPRMTVDQAIAQLREHLVKTPNDPQAWLLLGRFYGTLKQPGESRDAYAHAMKLVPDNADIMVAWVEADSLARPDHHIDGATREQLAKALQIDPDNQRGLWLMGISDYQAGRFVDAVLTWRRLQVLLKPDSDVADAVSRQIAMANARAAGKTQAQAETLLDAGQPKAPVSASSIAAPTITINVQLAPTLKSRVQPEDTVFVYARAADGAPMPLAIERLKASALPATVVLTDAAAMAGNPGLAAGAQVTLIARISRSGQATPQSGDLQGQVGPVTVGAHTSARIIISHAR